FQQIQLEAPVVAAGIEKGDVLVLTRDAGAEGGAAYGFYDYARNTPIIVLAITFAVVVGLVARLRGLASLVGLTFAFVVLLQFVLPGLLSENSPTLVSLVGSAAIMFVVLYLAHGFSARTTTALVGTLFGLTLVAVMGSIAVSAARLTGLTSEETVQLQGYDPTLNFSGLVLAGIVVAGLGVLNDVTITQASAIWQLHEVSPQMSWRELYSRGMAVGRDHIASTVYTIVFAYAGAALPLLLLFEVYTTPAWTLVTSSAVAEELIRTMVGAIALVLAVPVTTAAGAFFAKAADTEAGAATERRVTALRARFAR
ncbi:MAG TPA: YibE/F family protein, partial [Blastococcus sp.]